MPNNVMIFAAGFGTRMGALTAQTPKPLVKVAGRPMIDHALDLIREVEPDRIVANVHYRAAQLEAHFHGTDVQTVREEPDILETGGGLRNALPLLGEGPVYTVNSDAIWSGENPLIALREAWDPHRMDALLMCVPLENAVGYEGAGNFRIDTDGRLKRRDGLVYGGIQILKTDGLADIEADSFSLRDLWDRLEQKQRLFGIVHTGQWCDVGHPAGIPLAEGVLAQNV